MTTRPILTRCASAALCCALLVAPMPAQASPVSLLTQVVVAVAKQAVSPSSPLKEYVLPLLVMVGVECAVSNESDKGRHGSD